MMHVIKIPIIHIRKFTFYLAVNFIEQFNHIAHKNIGREISTMVYRSLYK